MGGPKIEKIEDIQASLATWDFIAQLPEQVGSFKKQPGRGIEGQMLFMVSYVDEEHYRRLDLVYTKETFDYLPLKMVGLNIFRDERYYCRDKEKFAKLMLEHLEQLLEEISADRQSDYGYEGLELHFDEWEYWKSLPKQIGKFQLFITPDKPVKYINGSTIFLDYMDFEKQSHLYFLFNGYRTEVFGEMLQNNVPVTTKDFTVPEENEHGRRKTMTPGKILPRFEELLKANLERYLEILGRDGFETL